MRHHRSVEVRLGSEDEDFVWSEADVLVWLDTEDDDARRALTIAEYYPLFGDGDSRAKAIELSPIVPDGRWCALVGPFSDAGDSKWPERGRYDVFIQGQLVGRAALLDFPTPPGFEPWWARLVGGDPLVGLGSQHDREPRGLRAGTPSADVLQAIDEVVRLTHRVEDDPSTSAAEKAIARSIRAGLEVIQVGFEEVVPDDLRALASRVLRDWAHILQPMKHVIYFPSLAMNILFVLDKLKY